MTGRAGGMASRDGGYSLVMDDDDSQVGPRPGGGTDRPHRLEPARGVGTERPAGGGGGRHEAQEDNRQTDKPQRRRRDELDPPSRSHRSRSRDRCGGHPVDCSQL
jgi:hypothetical protein